MTGIGRAVAEGYPHHVVQRGNNREGVFSEKTDRRQTDLAVLYGITTKRLNEQVKRNRDRFPKVYVSVN